MESNRYLVTGCAGFIGSVVSQLLLKEGHCVVGLDNLDNAYDPSLKRWRWEQLRPSSRCTFALADITRPDELRPHFSHVPRFDAVFHLAARAGVRPSMANPRLYYESNTFGTLHLLELCREFGVKKFVLASSSSVYGSSQVPFSETATQLRPLSPYAASKQTAETLAHTYHLLHGLDVSVLRYFTVYGPAGRPDMSVFRFIRWMATGQEITIFGDGRQQRDFTYVDDIARGTVAAVRPLGYEIINLGSGQCISLIQLIAEIAREMGVIPVIQRRSAHPGDMPATWADIEKAHRLLDWKPSTMLPAGVRACVAWYQANRELADGLDLGD